MISLMKNTGIGILQVQFFSERFQIKHIKINNIKLQMALITIASTNFFIFLIFFVYLSLLTYVP
jgi:hypothetical protein